MTGSLSVREREIALLHEAADAVDTPLQPGDADKLSLYLDQLIQWNAAYNLTAVRDRAAMRVQHLNDCLAIVAPLRRQLKSRLDIPQRLLDVGSGGGLPGIVLAIAFPQWTVVCVDSVGKKAAFIRQVAMDLRLPNLSAEHARVEALACEPFDLLTCRAFSTLSDFFCSTCKVAAVDACHVAMKGRVPVDELKQLPASATVFHVEQLVVPDLAGARCLVWMRKAQARAVSAA